MGDGSLRTRRRVALATLALGLALFALVGYYEGPVDDSLESRFRWDLDLVALPSQILLGLATSCLFVGLGYLLWEVNRWFAGRSFEAFFGSDIASGDSVVALVHPHYELTDQARRALAGAGTDGVPLAPWQHSGTRAGSLLPIEFEEALAANDIAALMFVGASIRRRDDLPPTFLTDTQWRSACESGAGGVGSAISAGLTANAMRDVFEERENRGSPPHELAPTALLRTCPAPTGQRPHVLTPGHDPFCDTATHEYGIVVRYTPDRQRTPGKRWFIVAGLGPVGTPAAGLFLASRWQELERLTTAEDDVVAVVSVPAGTVTSQLTGQPPAAEVLLVHVVRRSPGGTPEVVGRR